VAIVARRRLIDVLIEATDQATAHTSFTKKALPRLKREFARAKKIKLVD